MILQPRKIRKVLRSVPTIEGAGVHLKRAFGFSQKPELDPFLLLDDFSSDNPEDYLKGFPWHPHRGIETITYLLHGSVEHGDSLGNEGVIHSGDIQWMTAGSGIIHQEMPRGREDGLMRGLQLWANLPASSKMMPPRYRDITSAQIPEVQMDEGVTVKVVAGELRGVRGPVQDIVIDPEYLDVTIAAGKEYLHPVPAGFTVFAYILEGSGYFDQNRDPYSFEMATDRYIDVDRACLLSAGHLVIYEDGDGVVIQAGPYSIRFLLLAGKPIGEPIAWYGPIVMNTREELRVAFDEFQKGTFLKHKI